MSSLLLSLWVAAGCSPSVVLDGPPAAVKALRQNLDRQGLAPKSGCRSLRVDVAQTKAGLRLRLKRRGQKPLRHQVSTVEVAAALISAWARPSTRAERAAPPEAVKKKSPKRRKRSRSAAVVRKTRRSPPPASTRAPPAINKNQRPAADRAEPRAQLGTDRQATRPANTTTGAQPIARSTKAPTIDEAKPGAAAPPSAPKTRFVANEPAPKAALPLSLPPPVLQEQAAEAATSDVLDAPQEEDLTPAIPDPAPTPEPAPPAAPPAAPPSAPKEAAPSSEPSDKASSPPSDAPAAEVAEAPGASNSSAASTDSETQTLAARTPPEELEEVLRAPPPASAPKTDALTVPNAPAETVSASAPSNTAQPRALHVAAKAVMAHDIDLGVWTGAELGVGWQASWGRPSVSARGLLSLSDSTTTKNRSRLEVAGSYVWPVTFGRFHAAFGPRVGAVWSRSERIEFCGDGARCLFVNDKFVASNWSVLLGARAEAGVRLGPLGFDLGLGLSIDPLAPELGPVPTYAEGLDAATQRQVSLQARPRWMVALDLGVSW